MAEARASDKYKRMIVEGSCTDILYTPFFTGVPGNYLRASIVNAGLDPDRLESYGANGMDFSLPDSKKPWQDIWGSGQGIGAIRQVLPARQLVQRLSEEYDSARAALAA